jgi:nucleoside-diphosphate-sugar epimerase
VSSADWSRAHALVTGGGGFIGSHLVDALLEQGAKVRVMDNYSTGRRENLEHCRKQIEIIEKDIRDLSACRRATEGVTHVFHQAALGSVPRSMEDPATSIEVNVSGTANVFAAARDAGVPRVVYASSSAVYGDSETLPKREGQEGAPLSPYAVSKWMNEELAEVYARCYGMAFVGLRYFNVYGPRQDPSGPYAAVIPRFFDAAARGEAPIIFGDGLQSRDFTFVGDVVQANLLAASAEVEGAHVCNIGAGATTTVKELADTICKIMSAAVKPMHEPPRPGDVMHSQADASRARELFDFAAHTRLEDGLRQTKP